MLEMSLVAPITHLLFPGRRALSIRLPDSRDGLCVRMR